MSCKPWKHKWVGSPFHVSGKRCKRCGDFKHLNYRERKARRRRMARIAATLTPSWVRLSNGNVVRTRDVVIQTELSAEEP